MGTVAERGKRVDFLNEYAVKRCGMPEGWEWFKWEATGRIAGSRLTQGHIIIGAVAPRKTKGKYAGQRNWKARDKSTEVTLAVSAVELDAFTERWERDTGFCSYCFGTGQAINGWNRIDGTTYAPCRRCKATGSPPHLIDAVRKEG